MAKSKQPRQGRTTITTSAQPITQLLENTSGTTSFTATTVSDAAAWDLSSVQAGHIIEADDYFAYVESVDDAGDTITIRRSEGWVSKGGQRGQGAAANMPSAGSTVIVHRADQCRTLLVDALDSNTADVFLGFDDTVTVTGGANPGHPIAYSANQPNHRFIEECGLDRSACDFLDLTQVFVIAASTQEVSWVAS